MRRTVAVDLDGVLADYSKGWQGLDYFGDPIPGAVEFLDNLASFADIMIYTSRCSDELKKGYSLTTLKRMVTDWLDKHEFTYHDVWIGQGKPIASAYIDDRAVACTPQSDARAFDSAITRAKRLCNETK